MKDRAEQIAEDSKTILQYMKENMPPVEVALAMRRMMTVNKVMMIEAEPELPPEPLHLIPENY